MLAEFVFAKAVFTEAVFIEGSATLALRDLMVAERKGRNSTFFGSNYNVVASRPLGEPKEPQAP